MLTKRLDVTYTLVWSVAIANIIGLYMLMPKVKALVADYHEKLASGEIKKIK